MAEHVWTILCQSAETDPTTNNITLRNVIEEFQVQTPAPERGTGVAIGAALVTLWRRSDSAVPEEIVVRLRLRHPNGVESPPFEMPVSLTDHLRSRAIAAIPALTVTGSGTYKIVVEHHAAGGGEWTHDASVPFEVVVTRQG